MTQEDIIKELEAMAANWNVCKDEHQRVAQKAKAHGQSQTYMEQMSHSFGYQDCLTDIKQLLTKIKQQ